MKTRADIPPPPSTENDWTHGNLADFFQQPRVIPDVLRITERIAGFAVRYDTASASIASHPAAVPFLYGGFLMFVFVLCLVSLLGLPGPVLPPRRYALVPSAAYSTPDATQDVPATQGTLGPSIPTACGQYDLDRSPDAMVPSIAETPSSARFREHYADAGPAVQPQFLLTAIDNTANVVQVGYPVLGPCLARRRVHLLFAPATCPSRCRLDIFDKNNVLLASNTCDLPWNYCQTFFYCPFPSAALIRMTILEESSPPYAPTATTARPAELLPCHNLPGALLSS